MGLDKDVLFNYVQEKALGENPIWQNLIGCFIKEKAEEADNSNLFQQATEYYAKAAMKGYSIAQCNLANAYLHGRGIEKNENIAFEWYVKAAEQGNAAAQNNLASMCLEGGGCEQDSTKAFEWYTKAAEQGNPIAQYCLGHMHLQGRGVEKNERIAFKWYIIAAEQGNAFAQHGLGNMYQYGHFVKKNEEIAVEWYSKAAEQGNAFAQYGLGCMYFNGSGCKRNYQKAFELYTKAAEQGNACAQNNLAFMYKEGHGVEKNEKIAFKWYAKAAEQGIASAQNDLGIMYSKGSGCEQDYKEAVKWYAKAAEQGHSTAQTNLGVSYKDGYGVKQDYREAFKWFSKAAEQGDPISQVLKQQCLDRLTLNGADQKNISQKAKGQEIFERAEKSYNKDCNYKQAFREYLEAEKLGNEQAKKFLEHYYKKCNSRNTEHKNKHKYFNEVLNEFKTSNAVEEFYTEMCGLVKENGFQLPEFSNEINLDKEKETAPSKKKKRKKKKKKIQGASVVQQNEAVRLSIDTKQDENLPQQTTIQVIQPPLESQQVIVPEAEPTSVQQPVIAIAETQPVVTSFVSQEPIISPIKEEEQEKKHESKRIRSSLSRTISHRELGERKNKTSPQELEEKIQPSHRIKTLQRKNTLTELPKVERSRKGKEKDRTETSMERSSHRSDRIRNTHDGSVSRSERSSRSETSRSTQSKSISNTPSLKPLIKALEKNQNKNLREINLHMGTIEKGLKALDELYGLTTYNQQGNTISSTSRVNPDHHATMHMHGKWYKNPDIVEDNFMHVWKIIGGEGKPTTELLLEKLESLQKGQLANTAGEGN